MSDRERALFYCLIAVVLVAVFKYMQWNDVAAMH